jgi:hypothetical protein
MQGAHCAPIDVGAWYAPYITNRLSSRFGGLRAYGANPPYIYYAETPAISRAGWRPAAGGVAASSAINSF